jgi:murein DD-endopeptidase MepM/ murein hydrolase activator NlpD
MGGNFRQHQGCEYNNPEGTELLAVDDGMIVYVNKEIGHTVLRCDTRFEKYYVYAHYHHMHEISREIGQRVLRGDVIGTIGKKGNVTNEHLHFEVSLSLVEDSNVPNQTVNNELWQKPLSGCGTIAGNIIDGRNRPIMGARICGVEKPGPTETPFTFAESYRDSVRASPAYNENFVIADVPEGKYLLWSEINGVKYAVSATVEAGRVTRVKIMAAGQGTTIAEK